MAGKTLMELLRKDFSFLKSEGVLAVLLFGSSATGDKSARDADICIVAPKMNPSKILSVVFSHVDVVGKKYDVYCFEELPLYMKWEVIHNNKVIWAKSELDLGEYFYYYRKLYADQKHRMDMSRAEVLELFHKLPQPA